jgi:periodic tryptophan protein 1
MEWLPVNFKNTGNTNSNYVIVGSFLPEIEIWNLDMLDVLEPDLVLGENANTNEDKYFKDLKKKKNKIKNKTSENNNTHTDAVLSLNLNPFNNSILCSSSADSKILFWDLTSGKSFNSIIEHKDKVQAVKWNKIEDNVLLSGSYDKTIKLFDVRDKNSSTTIKISSDIESMEWSPLNKYLFLSSYENGRVDLYDIRKFDTIVSFQAHKKAASCVSFSNQKEGLFATCGIDSYVKVWDAENVNMENGNNNISANLLCERFVKKSTVRIFFKFFLSFFLIFFLSFFFNIIF